MAWCVNDTEEAFFFRFKFSVVGWHGEQDSTDLNQMKAVEAEKPQKINPQISLIRFNVGSKNCQWQSSAMEKELLRT